MEGEVKEMSSGPCRCPHHKATATFLLLIAVVFILKALGFISSDFADLAWPVLLGMIALKKMSRGMCKCCNDGGTCNRDCCK